MELQTDGYSSVGCSLRALKNVYCSYNGVFQTLRPFPTVFQTPRFYAPRDIPVLVIRPFKGTGKRRVKFSLKGLVWLSEGGSKRKSPLLPQLSCFLPEKLKKY